MNSEPQSISFLRLGKFRQNARHIINFILVFILLFNTTGCSTLKVSEKEQLPVVSELVKPKLPDWIEEITPTGIADPLAQIRIRFKEALIPVEKLDTPQQQQLLQLFEVIPPIPGAFRFLTPRMVGFQADKALPKATRLQVTLKSGLGDLKNHRLDRDLPWTFNTETIKLTNLSKTEKDTPNFWDLNSPLEFTSNVELDLDSVLKQVRLTPVGKGESVPVKVSLKPEENTGNVEEEEAPAEKFDPTSRDWTYLIAPQRTLEKATNYKLELSSGVRPVLGNIVSDRSFSSQVSTYSALQFKKIEFYGQPNSGGTYGRFVKGSPQLVFNNEVTAESAINNITVNPPIKNKAQLIQSDENTNIISLNPYALEPATNYRVTVGKDLKDKFGQTLDKPVTLQYQTGDLGGDIWVPSSLNIFPSGKNLQLNISTINLPDNKYKAAYQVVEPTDLVYDDAGSTLLPNPSQWQSFPVSAKKNQYKDTSVPIREKLNSDTGMLVYGVQARTNKYQENGKQLWREPTTYGMVQLTNLGVFSQWFPESGLIRVNHLADGSPAVASVEVYESKLSAESRSKSTPCASGKTDSNGTLILNTQDIQGCVKSGSAFTENGPSLLIIARENKDWAFTRTDSYSGSYGYGVYTDWDSGKPIARGAIFSDRKLYQPGEKVALTGMAYFLEKGILKSDKNATYDVKLVNPDGKETSLGTQNTNQFGTFSVEFNLQNNQPLGYYSLLAKGKDGREINGEIRVAEFKPPNFKVDLSLDKEFAFPGAEIQAKAVSNYLFGAPVEGGKAKYNVTRSQTTFIPKGWEEFQFGKQWFYPEESPNVPSDVLQTDSVLDAAGKSSQSVKVASDIPYPMTYQVDVQVTDVSNLGVSNSQSFIVLPSDRLIGLKSNFVADAGKGFPIQIIVTDNTGKAIAGQQVHLELQEMKYNSVTQLVAGSQKAKNQVEYQTVDKTDLQSADTPQTVNLTPPKSGSYRIRACTDVSCNAGETDLQIWVTGNNAVDWALNPEDKDKLELKLDKPSYKPGNTATALIQSPYPEGELYFAVVRDRTLYSQTLKVKGGAPQVQFQVTPEMLPNAAIEAILVRQGAPLSKIDTTGLPNLTKIGFAPFQVNLEEKYLKLQITPSTESLLPATEQTIQLELKNSQGNPVQGQVTIMVVNEAVLQLSAYRPPDLVTTVYAEQPITTRFSDNRRNVVLKPQSSPLPKGWGYGGGFSAAAANTRTRKDFQPLAYYNGSLLTDTSGKATVKFKLPDDLTTWRILAVATDENQRFGNAEATFITTQPLITNPVLPQFARPGDRFLAGVSVTNNTKTQGSLDINSSATGSIQLTDTSNLQVQTASGTQAYRFPVVAGSPGTGKISFKTYLNSAADAFEVPLEVKQIPVTEQVVETGTTTNTVKIPVNVDSNVVNDTGGLEISLGSTLIPEINAAAQQVLTEEQLPFLEPAASQLAIASNLQTLSQKAPQNFSKFNPSQTAKKSILTLQKLQKPDGGFAAYPKAETSDPWGSAYAAISLNQARQAFPDLVKAEAISNLRGYLKQVLLNPGKYGYCQENLCKNQLRLESLIALAELGEKRNDFLADIYQMQNKFDSVTRIKLTRYLFQFPEWQKEARELSQQFSKNVYQSGRTATVNIPAASWINSPTSTQSQFLRLFIVQKAKPEVIDRLFKGLLALRRNGTWQNSYDNAEALTALAEYSNLQPTPPNFTAKTQLAGKKLGETKFVATTTSAEIKVPIAELPRGRNDLIVQKSGKGTLHYLVDYRYRLPGNQPGRFNGLRVVREISRINQTKPLQKLSLFTPDNPLIVEPGQVFDINLEIVTDHPVDHVIVTDPLPAGLEAVDASLQATAVPGAKVNEDIWLKVKDIYRDRIFAYSDRLEPGVYNLHYLVRSVTPGTFYWQGAEAHLQYAPEEFGRSADATLIVSGNS
ncbi:alpha-2-macroglobulin family protein [Merismopedia glauca]|uniref:Alpha-2-macroglobulin n=1 Tax=Merismopedia glauca CCAP 1448/3 TaxID=1296344 RepID=A0A2T1C762_9CYAN|nr:alpha-2-macroglobulin [Merismopedia glauca]PSB03983.1 hypothetical protein C7B64_05945 [Merismopedia glauca CCAP 1448/3]